MSEWGNQSGQFGAQPSGQFSGQQQQPSGQFSQQPSNQFAGQQQQYNQQGSAPGGPGGPGGWNGHQGGGAPPVGGSFLPATASDPCCSNDQSGVTYACTSQCDVGVWLLVFWSMATIIGFGLAVGMTERDIIWTQLGNEVPSRTSNELQAAMWWYRTGNNRENTTTAFNVTTPEIELCENFTCDQCTTSATARRQESSTPQPTFPPVEAEECAGQLYTPLTGSWGRICMEKSMDATPILMNISRWVNFRATLYFLCMMGTLCTFVLVIIVHRVKNPSNVPLQQGPNGMMVAPPMAFNGTPLYHVFRTAWFVVSLVVFFWVVLEMYQYWTFIEYYREHSIGPMATFWTKFEKKHTTSVVFAAVYLCWPFCNLVLEIVFWFLLVAPWYMLRSSCYADLDTVHKSPETDLHDLPLCIRLDMFFIEAQQLRRVGFSMKLWHMVTGSRAGWCDEFGQPANGQFNVQPQGGHQQQQHQQYPQQGNAPQPQPSMGGGVPQQGPAAPPNQSAVPPPGQQGPMGVQQQHSSPQRGLDQEMRPTGGTIMQTPAAHAPGPIQAQSSFNSTWNGNQTFNGNQTWGGSQQESISIESPSKSKRRKSKSGAESDTEESKKKKKSSKHKK